ncbi:MAG TPA: DNA-directed RNA polymerase subunit delta [Candidatus Fimihabitans intestinipullorum]|uniref:RNAP delta factor n=1 Tax=Candidatus Fimihabitans intestinipullorum TaxID=2840820 RepID=A0A9D1HVS0_9BACT|nr:DNA-directed RNA polymerase subunit delta [Candidatus Fimihabitans intestinipullorum]
MKLKQMSKEELELLSYTDLTYMILKENKKSMNTPTIFKKICDLLGYSDEEYSAKIGDYYTSLTIDKRFVLLDNAEWDLRDHHSIEIVIDDEEDDENDIVEEEDDIEAEPEEIDGDDIDDIDEEDPEDTSDIEELSIIADEEIEEE